MPEKKRFLKSVNVNFISLVDKAANQKTIIFKSADPSKNTYQKIVQLKKVDEDQHMVYGIVYSPNQPDTDGDFTTAEVIKQMAYDFMKNRNTTNIDKQHDFNADEGFVAESWLTKSGDPIFTLEPEGSWAVGIKVIKEDTWTKVKSGEITGLSMAGLAVVEEVQKSNLITLDQEAQESFFNRLTKSIKETFTNLKKDFNSNFNNDVVRRMGWALTDAIGETLNDETIVDKKAAILANVEQFKAALEKVDFNIGKTINATTGLTKAGKIFNAKNLQSLKEMKSMIETMISQMEEEETKINKQKNGDTEMTPEEIQAIVKTAVEEALKPVSENIEKMKTEVNGKASAIEQRLEKVEKASPGSAQNIVVDGVGIQKDEKYTGVPWLT